MQTRRSVPNSDRPWEGYVYGMPAPLFVDLTEQQQHELLQTVQLEAGKQNDDHKLATMEGEAAHFLLASVARLIQTAAYTTVRPMKQSESLVTAEDAFQEALSRVSITSLATAQLSRPETRLSTKVYGRSLATVTRYRDKYSLPGVVYPANCSSLRILSAIRATNQDEPTETVYRESVEHSGSEPFSTKKDPVTIGRTIYKMSSSIEISSLVQEEIAEPPAESAAIALEEIEEKIYEHQIVEQLPWYLLSDKQASIIKTIFGIGENKQTSIAQTAKEHGMTRQNMDTYKKRALEILRDPDAAREKYATFRSHEFDNLRKNYWRWLRQKSKIDAEE